MIEYFVHIDPHDSPKDLVVVKADVPATVSRVSISETTLPSNWRQSPAPAALAGIGDKFVRQLQAAILIIPSTLAPAESNWLINPAHPEFSSIRIHSAEPFEYDLRFFKA